MKHKRISIITAIMALITCLLHVLQYKGALGLYENVLMTSRWMMMGLLMIYGFRKKSLTTWIFISMLLGIEIGYDFKDIGQHLNILSKIFLKLIKTIITPLLFGTLVVGIAGHSNMKQVGRMGWKSLVYFEIVTTIALFVGLAAINISQAGHGVKVSGELASTLPQVAKQNAEEIILHIFPENFAKSFAEGQVLQIVVFSILFGIALAMLPEEKKKPLLEFSESLSETMFKFTGIVMYAAPFGVAGAIAYTVSSMGLGILTNLFMLLATLYISLIAFLVLVLLPIALFLKIPIKGFIKAVTEPVSLAFATASSEAALPKAMEKMVEFGVPRKVVAFVMPTGYSFNLDGTTLYLSLAAVFVAQAANVPLTFSEQLVMVFTLMLTSKGVAGVPRASLVILLGTVASFKLPEWPVYIILGIDTLMDMARTSVNVIGNCLASVVVAKWEGEFQPTKE
jgi:proton glutamate symport protein